MNNYYSYQALTFINDEDGLNFYRELKDYNEKKNTDNEDKCNEHKNSYRLDFKVNK